MRTTLMVSLLAVSLGLTATCLLIIRFSVRQEIRRGLDADISHSLTTFRNIADQRNQMLARETALLADLPSLKALMATQDVRTIQDGSNDFWMTSGSDFFALSASNGQIFTYSNRGSVLNPQLVAGGLQACMASVDETCMVAFGPSLYQLSIKPLYFGPRTNGSELGYVILGYVVDEHVAHQVSDVAAAEVAFLVNSEISATTLPPDRLPDLRSQISLLNSENATPQTISLSREAYTAAGSSLSSAGNSHVEIVVLKSYDRASMYLRRVNQWIITLGICTLFLGVLLAAAISRTVTRPLEALVAGTRALGQGDFSYRLTNDGAVEVRELGLAFERMRGELQRTQTELLESDRLATIGRMASSVSHDLRHHLSAIYANAEFMSHPAAGNEERLELLIEVREAVQGMTDLIESLLLFGQTGQILQLQFESIPSLLDRTVHTVRQHPECRDVRITTADMQPIEACLDGAKLGRAIYNLLLNACQSARTGAPPAVVSLSLSEDEERIRIAITDTGKGVSPTIVETLFQPFVSAGKVNGTGLGLTVAQHIAQEHGGEIRLERSMPGNTTFSILLYKKALQTLSHRVDLNVDQPRPQPVTSVEEQPIPSTQENP